MSSNPPPRLSRSLDRLASMRRVRPWRPARRPARWLTVVMVVGVGVLAMAPWQQTASGHGRVIAYAPLERRQSIEAPIDGRVVRWHVHEGSRVRAGEPIVDIADNDPAIVHRLTEERDATRARLDALTRRLESIDSRISLLQAAREDALRAAGARVRMAGDRTRAAQRALDAARAAAETAHQQYERQRSLGGHGLASTRTVELAQLDDTRARVEVDRAEAALSAARSEEVATRADQQRLSGDTAAAIDDARASHAAAASEQANIRAEIARVEVRLARQASQQVTAPRDGTIHQLLAAQGSEMVRAGDSVAILVPDTDQRAVELWIDGNDVPLVSPGREVRLQFEGWPAVQFSGWPSVAVGTFGGRVAFIDATDNGRGQFRIVVVPQVGEHWPTAQYLRQGVRVNGWVLLNRVRLGYELWRQFNGFPATSTPATTQSSSPSTSSSYGTSPTSTSSGGRR